MGDKTILLIAAAFFVLFFFVGCALLIFALPIWKRALLGGIRVSIVDIVGMRARGNPAGLLVDTALALKQRGVEVRVQEVEKTYIAHKGQSFTPSELADLIVQQLGKSDQSGV